MNPEITNILDEFIFKKINIHPEACQKYGEKNKGKHGLTVEDYLGLARNNRAEPDHPDFELKTVSVKSSKKRNKLIVKETVAAGMHGNSVIKDKFLYKNKKTLFVFIDKSAEKSGIVLIVSYILIDLLNLTTFYIDICKDIDDINKCSPINSSAGYLIQSRTKGSGKSLRLKSRALYYKKLYLNELLEKSMINLIEGFTC